MNYTPYEMDILIAKFEEMGIDNEEKALEYFAENPPKNSGERAIFQLAQGAEMS